MTANIKKRGRLTLPAKASVFYTLTGALERGVNFIFTPIFTRLLTPEEFGLYPLYVSWLGVITVLATLELSGSVIYKALSRYRGRESDALSSSLGLISLSSLTVLALILIFSRAITALTGLTLPVLILLILQIFANGVTNLYFAKCRYFYKYKSASLINILSAIASPALSFLIVRLTALHAEARIIGPLAVGLIISAPLLVSFVRGSRRLYDGGMWKYLIRLVLPLLPHFLATTVISQSGKLVIGRYLGEGALARYSLVFSLGFLFTVITAGISSGLSPWINRKLSHGAAGVVDIMTERLFILFAVLTLMAVTFVPEGLGILAPAEYLTALGAVYPIAISVLVSFLGSVLYAVIVYYEKTYLVTASSTAVAVVTVALHLIFTSVYGYMSAALVQCAASALLATAYAVILGGVLKKHDFRWHKYLLTLLAASVGAALLSYFRGSLASRALIFAALLLMLIPTALSCYRMIKEK